MRNVVFWSAGQDSTLVAVDLLRSREPMTLLTAQNIMIGGVEFHDKEKLMRKKCLQKMKTEFGETMVAHEEFLFDGKISQGEHLGLASMLINVMHLACDKDDTVYFGFIRYSDFWHYKQKFVEANDKLNILDGKDIKLKFPLEWNKKHEIVKRLKQIGYYAYTLHSDDFKVSKIMIK